MSSHPGSVLLHHTRGLLLLFKHVFTPGVVGGKMSESNMQLGDYYTHVTETVFSVMLVFSFDEARL